MMEISYEASMSHNIRLTFGVNRFDTQWVGGQGRYLQPLQVSAIWADYVDLLRAYAAIPRKQEEKDRTCPWTSPMLLHSDGEGRGMDNVAGLSAFTTADLDAPGWTLDKLNQRLDGFARLFYTTTKSRPSHQRWRIMVLLDREITVEEHGAVWNCLNHLLDGQLDRQTKNANRIQFVPAQWGDADNIFAAYDGDAMPVDVILEDFKPIDIATYNPITHMVGEFFAPDSAEIITERMIKEFTTALPGGRFWKLLCAGAARYRKNGWQLSAGNLCAAAMQVSAMYAPNVHRYNPLREATRALAWVDANVQPEPPLKRLKDRLRWQLQHST